MDMKIIDAHAHIFPDKIVGAATEAIRGFYDKDDGMAHVGSTAELIASGSKIGVDKYLVFSTATTPAQVPKINDFILSECAAHPEFIAAGTMHRDFEDYEAELERIYAAGMRGIKLHPDFQQFNFDDEKLDGVYRVLSERGMFVITHAGDFRYDFSHPCRIANVAKRFPRLRIIAAHMGGWSQWKVARNELNLPNVWYDTSSIFGFAGAEPVVEGLKTFGHERVFFGVDFPMWDHKNELDNLLSIGLSENVLEDILFNNFNDFYGGNL